MADDDLLPVGRNLLNPQAPIEQQEELLCRGALAESGGAFGQAPRDGQRQHRVDVLGRGVFKYLETAN